MAGYNSQKALLAHIIDYAGTFPPASLTLEKTLERAATFRKDGTHPWLMAKTALNMADLKKLSPSLLYDHKADGASWVFTALGSQPPEEKLDSVLQTIDWDTREIVRWNERMRSSSLHQLVVGYETKLPLSLLDAGGETQMRTFVHTVLDRFNETSRGELSLFLELPLSGEWLSRTNFFTDSLASWIEKQENEVRVPAIKLRTGGNLVPTMEQVAEILIAVCSRTLRFKATQGLHEAFTHNKSLGFINLFASLTFLQSLGLEKFSKMSLLTCLSEEKGSQFIFGKSHFKWQDFSLDTNAIESARRRHGGCFGSCSVDEPDESLKKVQVES